MTSTTGFLSLAVLSIAAYAARTWLLAWRKGKQLKLLCPGGNPTWVFPLGALQLILGRYGYPFPGSVGHYYSKFEVYKKHGSTCLSTVATWGTTPVYYMTNVEAIKKVLSDRHVFIKDVRSYEMLNIWGPNVVSAEGDQWKRHRMIANPAFNQANTELVWKDAMRAIGEWLEELDERGEPGTPIDVSKETAQVTLLVIASSAFGRHVSYREHVDKQPPLGHTMPFGAAVNTALTRLLFKVLTPRFVWNITTSFSIPFISPLMKETKAAFDALEKHMLEVTSEARAMILNNEPMDAALLRNMVKANVQQEGLAKTLTDDELLSNTMTFLLAGHETTAHTVAFALALIALYPDVQARIFKEINYAWPESSPAPGYKEALSNLEYTVATVMETLRVCPAVPRLGKLAQSDTVITSLHFSMGENGTIENITPFEVPIEKGTAMMVDIMGLHMNPIYWGPNPGDFNPENFIDTETYRWPRDAFLGFSGGARSCMGQRFAVAEAVCLITNIVRKYEVRVPSDVAGKSFEEQKGILLGWYPSITSEPTGAKVVFRPRS
ncbi:cytochrome P450 [Cylindrobasidium torrendii FP15055 ss-10]|uniref:Cytochrome P450 n=1 Tax=Cylindrobasidium torrendii FP15055 ss-10 TaxID=1314674 RepID=A0A0D7BPX9_9AGAR|nr:cytochrome P450 [Cylindrobasidium torrendii FP15055 ss-10]